MAHSISKVYLHTVFSTKYRAKTLTPEIEKLMYPYMAGIIKKLGAIPININGALNHIHILSTLPRTMTIADFIQHVKGGSSKWIKTQDACFQHFTWQNGYATFSVDQRGKDIVSNYIAKQKAHHNIQTFETELIQFLDEYEIEYDEKHLWD